MSYQFENRYILTEEMIQEYISRIVCVRLLKCCIVLFILFLLSSAIFICSGRFEVAAIFASCGFLSIAAGVSALVFAAKQQSLPHSAPSQCETVVRFGDRILVEDCGVNIWFDYSEITSVRLFNSFSVLQIGKKEAIILSPTGFSKGDRFSFWQFFREKRPDLWVLTAAHSKSYIRRAK